ncbi:MAG: hypothetical protein N2746_00295 [Deltaproteobacteria bacterium]|nr:hypothetical protein [Deltaproteobacteria bacterium]
MKKIILSLLISKYILLGCYSTEVIYSTDIETGHENRDCLLHPVFLVPPDKEVIPGQIVNLKVIVHPMVCQDEITGFEWSQIEGPTVHLSNNSSNNTSFIAPPEYEEIVLRIRAKGKRHQYEDTIKLRIVDTVENYAPYSDADGDIKIPTNYSHKISAIYSQGSNRKDMKYIWTTIPEYNDYLKIENNQSMETYVLLTKESSIPQILLLEVIENGLRSSRNIKLIHTNKESKSVIIAPRFQPEEERILANVNSDVELKIRNIEKYDKSEVVWYQLSGGDVELRKTLRGAQIRTSEFVDELIFSAFVKVDDLFSPPVFFKIITGETEGISPPIANAGADQRVKPLSLVKLNGTKSSVSYPRKIKYKWKQVYGNSVELKDSETPFPYFTAPRLSGKLIFLLTVNDGYVTSRPDTVIIDVSN